MNDQRADKRSAASKYGKWSSIPIFPLFVLDGDKWRDVVSWLEL